MTNFPIKPLASTGTFTGTEILPIIQGGTGHRATLADIRAFCAGSGSLTIATPAAQTVGVAFTVNGTYTNATPAALDYSLDGGTTWSAASSPTISSGAFSFSLTISMANSAQTIRVRDYGAHSVVALSGAFAVVAVPVESAEGATVTTVGPTIRDAALNVYSISSSGYVVTNGVPETTISANVVELYYHAPTTGAARQLYQRNSGGLWYTRPNPQMAYSQTSDPTMSVILPTTIYPPAAGPGPVSSSSFLSVDFGSPTGVFAPRHLWGLASAAPQNDHFALWNNTWFQNAIATIRPPVFRLNSNSGNGGAGISETGYWSDDIFVNGINNPNWNVIKPFIDNAYKFMDADTRIIVGVRLTGRSFSDYGTMCGLIGNHLKYTNGGNGVPVPIYGFEVGNEEDGHVSDADYCSYFNAAANAYHAIDPTWRLFGTVDSYMTATAPDGRFQTFANTCGSKGNIVLDYHGYSYGKQVGVASRTDQQLFTTQPADNGSIARQTVANTPLANAEIFMGEWNMDFNAADEVRQSQPIGACFAAYWMASAFKAHNNVTMGAMWEAYGDGFYGAIQGTGTIVPSGCLLQKAALVMGGNEVAASLGSGNALCLPIANGNHVAVMIVNWNTFDISGPVALNHWPINTSGTATITKWEISAAIPQGAPASIAVTAGLTPSITVPSFSVVILHN